MFSFPVLCLLYFCCAVVQEQRKLFNYKSLTLSPCFPDWDAVPGGAKAEPLLMKLFTL